MTENSDPVTKQTDQRSLAERVLDMLGTRGDCMLHGGEDPRITRSLNDEYLMLTEPSQIVSPSILATLAA